MTDDVLLDLRAPVRRYLVGRVERPEVEDLVQEVLLRVWEARLRTDPVRAESYAIGIASNLLKSRERRAQTELRHQPGLWEPGAPDDPELVLLSAEERESMAAALAALTAGDRRLLREAYLLDKPRGAGPRDVASTAGLATARARARVAYLLCLRRSDLPSEHCRRVLEALSSGDRRQLRRVDAERHLGVCPACGGCSAALQARRRALFGLLPLAPVAAWQALRQGPRGGQTVVVGATVAALGTVVGVAGVVAALQLPAHRDGLQAGRASAASAPELDLRPSGLLTDVAGAVVPASPSATGRPVVAQAVPVQSVPTDEGFWVGTRQERVFVVLSSSGESPVRVLPGERITFAGVLTSLSTDPSALSGLLEAEGRSQLMTQGAVVRTGSVRIVTR